MARQKNVRDIEVGNEVPPWGKVVSASSGNFGRRALTFQNKDGNYRTEIFELENAYGEPAKLYVPSDGVLEGSPGRKLIVEPSVGDRDRIFLAIEGEVRLAAIHVSYEELLEAIQDVPKRRR